MEATWRDLVRGGNAGRSAVVGGGMILHAINVFLVITIMPSVVADIGGLRLFAWSTTLYVVASLLGGVACARLMARIGTRWTYRLALGVFGLGCLACAIAPSMPVLLAGRLVQGLGAGTLSALSFTQIRLLFPAVLWRRAISIVSAMWGIATLLGPAVGGAFAEFGAWRATFWTLLAITPLLGALVEAVLPRGLNRPGRVAAAMDWLSLTILAGSVMAVSLAGTATAAVPRLAWLALGAAGVVVFATRERAPGRRVLPRDACRPASRLGGTYAVMVLLLLAVTADLFVPYCLQLLHGMRPLPAGYLAALLSAGWTLGSVISSGLPSGRIGAAMLAGPCLMAGGMLTLALLLPGGGQGSPVLAGIGCGLACVGLGIGLAWPHLAASAFAAAAPDEQALAAASVTTVTMLGNAFGSALWGVLANVAGLAEPGGATGAAHAALAVCLAGSLPPLLALPLVARLRPVRLAPLPA